MISPGDALSKFSEHEVQSRKSYSQHQRICSASGDEGRKHIVVTTIPVASSYCIESVGVVVTKPRPSHEPFRLCALVMVTTVIMTKVKVTRDLMSNTCGGAQTPQFMDGKYALRGGGVWAEGPCPNVHSSMKDSFLLSISRKPSTG